MADYWYPVTDHHPAPLVRVRGIIDQPGGAQVGHGGVIIISRGARPHHQVWVTWRAGRASTLAPGARPVFWQPQDAAKWRAPLPDPVPNMIVPPADAAPDRVAARGPDADQWWRDPNRIRYSGELTVDMVEGRVMRAVASCGHGYGTTPYMRTFSSVLADLVEENETAPYATSDYVPRFRPLPQDIADFDVAMKWFCDLNPVDLRHGDAKVWDFNRPQKALMYRALDRPWTYGKIAQKWGMTADGARKVYLRAVAAIFRAASGLSAYAHIEPVDQIAALRERNRMAKGAA